MNCLIWEVKKNEQSGDQTVNLVLLAELQMADKTQQHSRGSHIHTGTDTAEISVVRETQSTRHHFLNFSL